MDKKDLLMSPSASVRTTLLPALRPCTAFESVCKEMRWNPEAGHVPRGFCGATGDPEEVRLVLVCAEPGDPHPGENHEADGTETGRLDSVIRYAWDCFSNGHDQFHRNIREILNLFLSGLSFNEQMRRTWITDSVLCSARQEGGSVPHCVAQECIERNLSKQLALFRNATVVALGRKAQNRLRKAGIPFVPAFAAAPPGCNFSGARPSWNAAAQRCT